jgi:hypothetical protein
MPGQLNINATELVEFGVGLDEARGERYGSVPIDAEIQAALREMVITTRDELKRAGDSTDYDPGEKYGPQENLHLPLDSQLGSHVLQIHNATNLPSDPKALSEPANVFCYFARMKDKKGTRLTAIRRATSFKGVLKSRLIQLGTDALKLVHESIFKLDRDFDLLIDDTGIQILRATGFEFVGELEGAVLGAVSQNVASIKGDLSFVNFDPVEAYASKHPRAARYLASVRTQVTKNIDKAKLKDLCKRTGVKLTEKNGKLQVDENSMMGFLGVLDRRQYEVELINGKPEPYHAASRSRIQ